MPFTAILLGFLAAAEVAGAVEPRLLVFLNGSEVQTPIVSAERRGSEILLPVGPLSARLQSEAAFDAVSGKLIVSDPVLGRVTEYEQATGLVRRDGTILFGLAAGLLRGTRLADLVAPLPLVTILFHLEAEIPPGGDRVELYSRVGAPAGRLHPRTSVHMRDLRYDGYLNRYDGFTDGGLGVDAAARLSDGVLEVSAFGQAEEGHLGHLRNASITYRDPRYGVWSAIDLRSVGELPWLAAAGRGAAWSRVSPTSGKRTAAGIYETLVFSENLGRRVSAPRFEGLTVLGEHAVVPAKIGEPGSEVALGGGWLSRTEFLPAGLFTMTDLMHRSRTANLGLRAGLFAGTDQTADNGSGVELHGEWLPHRVWGIGGHFTRFDQAFRLPRPSFPEAGTRNLFFDTTLQPDPWFRVSASHGEQHSLSSGSLRSRLDNLSMGVSTPSPVVRSIHLSGSLYSDSASTDTRSLSLNLEGGGRRVRWFGSSRRQWDTVGDSWTQTLGGSGYTPAGDGQLSGSLVDGRLDGVAFYWTLPPLLDRTLQIGLGDRWERLANLDGEHFYGQFRAAWRGRGGHGVELSIEENQTTTSVRLSVSGGFLFPDVGTAPDVEFGTFDPSRGVLFGRAYVDANLNGTFDEGETPLAGVAVRLDGGRWRRETGADGRYEFPAVEAGQHRVELAEETVRADLTLLERNGGEVELPAMSRLQVDFRVAQNRAITGLVFADRNNNGRRDADEEGLPDVRLFVAGGADAITFHDGTFRMGDVAPGTRVLLVDGTSLASSFQLPGARQVQVAAGSDPEPLEIGVPVRPRPVERRVFSGG